MSPTAGEIDERIADRQREISISPNREAERREKSEPRRLYGLSEEIVLLDDLPFCADRGKFSLGELDSRLLEALLAVLESGQTETSFKMVSPDIWADLEWV